MALPYTPKKQALPETLTQQPTPPATQEAVPTVSSYISEKHPSFIPKDDTSDTLDLVDLESPHIEGPLVTGRVSYCTETGSPLPHTHYSASSTEEGIEDLEAEYSEPGNNGMEQLLEEPTQEDIKDWLKSSKDRAQHKRRFDSLLHSFWPSNDEFNAARHQDYDPEKHGVWYDDYVKDHWEDGHCPFDDDDYDPLTDPSKSREIWEPKIGEEGIEDEHDLCMVLKARQNHRALSEDHRKFRAYGGYQVLISNELASSYNKNTEEASIRDPASAVQLQLPPSVGNSSVSTNASIEPPEALGTPKTKWHRSLPMITKKKKRRVSKNSRKQKHTKEDPSGAYKYESDSSDEPPAYKKAKKANVKTMSNSEWKAQTRAAAKNQRR